VDFLLVFIELFSLGVKAQSLQANIGLKSAILLQRGPVDSKFQVWKGSPPPTILFLRKLGYVLWYGIKMWTGLSSVFFTVHAFDRQTDGRTDRRTDRQNSHR